MKVTLIFDMPDDEDLLLEAIDGWRWKLCLSEFDERLRRAIKYENREELSEVREWLRSEAEARGVSIW